MTDVFSQANTRNSKWIKAPPDVLYRAFTDPAALAVWQAPGDMTGSVHRFDYRVGGGYQMSLYYPSIETASPGKTEDREDRYTVRYRGIRKNLFDLRRCAVVHNLHVLARSRHLSAKLQEAA